MKKFSILKKIFWLKVSYTKNQFQVVGKKIDTSNDYEEEERQGRLMGFEAPMNGIEGDEVDNIYIEQDGDEFEVHIMTAFNKPRI